MAWDFSTEPEFQEKLDWARQFVADKVEPLDILYPHRQFHPLDDELRPIVDPMKQEVRDHDLWAAHLGPELGGKGYGQVKLALLNEILGVSGWAPIVFGTQAPDTGNAEIIAHYGTEEQKEKYLQPLLNGEVFSCYSMTEPQAGSDPQQFTCRPVAGRRRVGHQRVEVLLVQRPDGRVPHRDGVTDPDVSMYQGASMFLVPTDTPGVNMTATSGWPASPRTRACTPSSTTRTSGSRPRTCSGGEGQAFAIAQTRLGGGRVHHAMRTVATCQRALDLLCERVLSRETQGSLLARKQFIQGDIADSYAELQQFRLLVLYTAWEIDQVKDYRRTRKNIAAIKALTPKVVHDAVWRSMHAHGALGVSNEMPFGGMWMSAPIMSVVDGPTEVHKVTVAREVLKDYQPSPGLWPTAHLPAKREEAAGSWRRTSSTSSGTPELARARRPLLTSTGHPRPWWWSICADPVAGGGKVVVDVAAAAVNFPDVLLVADQYQVHIPVPFTVGSEFAGTVRAVGPGVDGVAVGDRVMGSTMVGAFAEQVVVSASLAAAGRPRGRPGARRRRRAWPTARRTTPCAALPGSSPGSGWWCWAPPAAWASPPWSWPRCSGPSVVAAASTAEKLALCLERGPRPRSTTARRTSKERIKEITGDGADVVIDPVGGPSRRAGAACVALGRPVRHGGLRLRARSPASRSIWFC